MAQIQFPNRIAPAESTNALGIAAFVCSLLGLFTGGHLLSPVGLILGIVALGHRPRGFAIAGLVLGLFGTCGWLIVLVVILAVGMAVAASFVGIVLLSQSDRLQITSDMARIAIAAEQYKDENRGIAPAGIEQLDLDQSVRLDPWGNPYRFLLVGEDPGFNLVSDGPDGSAGSKDDISLSRLDEYWEGAMKDFEREMERLGHQAEASAAPGIESGPYPPLR